MVGMATFGKGFSEHSQLRELIGLKPTWTKKEAIKRGFPEYQRLGNHRADDQANKGAELHGYTSEQINKAEEGALLVRKVQKHPARTYVKYLGIRAVKEDA